jgi:E3 ubiquitin-protein ligase CCNP1IP1
MSIDHDILRRKNEELAQAYKEKNRKLLRTQELYDKLKRKAMLGHIQDAAADAVDTTLQGTSSYAAQQVDRGIYEHQIGTPIHSVQYAERSDRPGVVPVQHQTMAPDPRVGTWAGQAFHPGKSKTKPWNTQNPNGSAANGPMTPLKHRQNPGANGLGPTTVNGLVSGTPAVLHESGRVQQPLIELLHNPRANTESFPGVGLSSHLKTSQGPLAPSVRRGGKWLQDTYSTMLLHTDLSCSCTTAHRTIFWVGDTSWKWN